MPRVQKTEDAELGPGTPGFYLQLVLQHHDLVHILCTVSLPRPVLSGHKVPAWPARLQAWWGGYGREGISPRAQCSLYSRRKHICLESGVAKPAKWEMWGRAGNPK